METWLLGLLQTLNNYTYQKSCQWMRWLAMYSWKCRTDAWVSQECRFAHLLAGSWQRWTARPQCVCNLLACQDCTCLSSPSFVSLSHWSPGYFKYIDIKTSIRRTVNGKKNGRKLKRWELDQSLFYFVLLQITAVEGEKWLGNHGGHLCDPQGIKVIISLCFKWGICVYQLVVFVNPFNYSAINETPFKIQQH